MSPGDDPGFESDETEVDRLLREIHSGVEVPVLLPIVRGALDAMDWSYTESESDGLVCEMAGEHTVYSFLFRVDEKLEIVCCYARVGFRVPPDKRLQVCEVLTRANYGLRVGNFEMDMEDGEIRYKASVDMEGGVLGETMVQNLVRASVAGFDRYYPAVMRVVYAGTSPAEAVADAER
ncbi:MAG TPA: YbjN domain-containing protein [Longimicrobium sp.]|jgi:hypothetical protein|uniref:YbjN domain-containing protein n=1 Tax=Longimicrobium sp. TaxID=2029185 RepID=UPI002ED9430F